MEPRVENLPLPLDRSLYREAVDTYLELSHRYIEALYGFGNVRYPGLSDLDLLVVPKDSYLAPLHLHLRGRLPRRFDPILEHDVFVVPYSQLGVCRYRLSSASFSLVYGRDVLAGVTYETPVAARVCNALEETNTMLGYVDQLRQSRVLNARSCIRVFNSQRYKARRLMELGLMEEDGYGVVIDALRTRFMTDPSPECVLEMHHAFEHSVAACARALESALGLDVSSFDRIAGISYGKVPVRFEGFDIADAQRRADAITAYRQELVSRNYWYGFWFIQRIFPAAAARAPWHHSVFRLLRSGSRRWRRLRGLGAPSARSPLPGAPARSLPQPG
jgi:hypothetical protein